jgi:hypothetical protein
MKKYWGGEGAESTEELDWDTTTDQDFNNLKNKQKCKSSNQ